MCQVYHYIYMYVYKKRFRVQLQGLSQYFWFSLDIIMHDQSKLEKYMYMWDVQEHQKLDTQPLVNFIFNWQTFGLVISA